mgnify:CR=1 FL=1
MSTLIQTEAPLYEGKLCNYDEHMLLEDDGFQYEIRDGVMHMVPAPFYSHQSLSGELQGRLYLFLEKNPIGIITAAPRDVKLSEKL